MIQLTEQSSDIFSKRLTYAACALWLVSLALPGFMVDSRAEPLFGGMILLLGPLFGWAVGGWAVYANIFFLVAAVALFLGRRPRGSVLTMLALAATLPLFEGVIRDEGSGTILPVVGWGWGAVLWIFSLIVLTTAAATRTQLLSLLGASVVLGLLLVSLVATAGFHLNQRSAANSQERSLYLSGGMAFTRVPPCDLPLTSVDAPLLPSNAIVALDVDPELVNAAGSTPYLWLPKLPNYQNSDSAWVTFSDPVVSSGEVMVRVAISPDRPVLQARKTQQGAVLRLLSRPSGPVLYEQKLKVTSTLGGTRLYCPMSTRSFTGLRVGYDTNVLRAVGQEEYGAPRREKLVEEDARIPCNLSAEDKDGTEGLRDWDGRQVILQPESVRSRPGFCSDTYIVLTYISDHSAGGLKDLSPIAQVFDRKTLRPLAAFNDRRVCPTVHCEEAPRVTARGVRVSDAQIIIETTSGDLVATRL
ncbi:hypothetical protein IV454_16170 [Massilia antarctica]|uniref:Uncharacterized protein n=1 Tax=Massilia antarctica TaxID=2765360 RepID=A0AA48WIF3_9BURK|nr:hypothetical protein [Massilia antarctica]QPI52883.1 hypothetical protein IV454_16170 [Massilia antarctica]